MVGEGRNCEDGVVSGPLQKIMKVNLWNAATIAKFHTKIPANALCRLKFSSFIFCHFILFFPE
jgi:hypothetical protein